MRNMLIKLCFVLTIYLLVGFVGPYSATTTPSPSLMVQNETDQLNEDGERGDSRGVILTALQNSAKFLTKPLETVGKIAKGLPTLIKPLRMSRPLFARPLFQVPPSQNSKIKPQSTTSKPIEPVKIADPKQYTREQLESALNVAGIKCGTVPLFEKLYKRSINESLADLPTEDTGEFRIINGIDSTPGEWPWIVRITECLNEDKCFTCTGTLLNNRWIISAGHCGFNRSSVHNFNATLGLYDMVSPDPGAFTTTIDKIIVHPDYQELTHDLALFRLSAPISFSEFVQPACLIGPTRNVLQLTRTRRCYAVGYGLTAGMMAAVKLQKLVIQPQPPSECNSDQLGQVQLRRNTICIGVPQNHTGGSCKGDSGGPDLFYDVKLNRWEIFGTVSYGPADCDRDTGEKWLTVSVDLSIYRTWILSSILANS